MIRHVGTKWHLLSKDGRKLLGRFDTKEQAEAHEEQVKRMTGQPPADMPVTSMMKLTPVKAPAKRGRPKKS